MHTHFTDIIAQAVAKLEADHSDYLVFGPTWDVVAMVRNGHRKPGSDSSMRAYTQAREAAAAANGHLIRLARGASGPWYDVLPVRYEARVAGRDLLVTLGLGDVRVPLDAFPMSLEEIERVVTVDAKLVLDRETPTHILFETVRIDDEATGEYDYAFGIGPVPFTLSK